MVNGEAAAASTASAKGQMKIIDLVKSDDSLMARCLVEYMDTDTREWLPVDKIKESNPRLLIDYYESRIEIVQKN